MRLILATLALSVILLAGCTTGELGGPGSGNGSVEHGEVTAITLVTPEGAGGYPYPGSSTWPISPVEALLPTGYPEITVVAPSGEVNPGELTPVAPNLTPQVMPSPGRPGGSTPQLSRFTEAIVRDLGRQIGVAAEDIRLVSAEAVVWPDGALGCPAEGTDYIEMQIEGLRLTFEADGNLYTYHTDGNNNYVFCRDGEPVSTGVVLQR